MNYKCSGLEIDTTSGVVSKDSERVLLSGLNLALLTALLQASPNRLSHEDLMRMVWQREVVSDATIAKRISLLREALSKLGADGNFIKTFPHKHYGLSHPVVVEQSDDTSATSPYSTLRIAVAISGLLIVSIVSLVALLSLQETEPARLTDPETGLELIAPN
ncbi:winged helix-turn-helix domain-containing protein [Hyphomonas sp. FCG-A18]|uniref:winged helix-turn-helix domain-containing protein n=1 Tax=Hyphomonas sp. FCG-A18 TaxID=3080019 RepID=UPI002B2DEE9D|nr:winged helix-turn-helix domain-containing protein [Hyphomonas sp. FCG-A18]